MTGFARAAAFAFTILGMAAAPGAQAAVISANITGGSVSGTGSVVLLDDSNAPAAVGNDNFNTNNLYIITEKQDFTLTKDVKVNFAGSEITLAEGTVVSSYYIVFDPASLSDTVSATIQFDSNILGFARKVSQLTGSDFLGLDDVDYLHPTGFGLEPTDTVTRPTASSLSINWTSGSPGDVLRVLTVGVPGATPAVPEPATWAMMIAGFGLAGASMRRRRATTLAFA
jgi:hypothetical protein